MSDWDTNQLWQKQTERQLNEIASATKGNRLFQADRISDLVAQINELRREIGNLRKELDKSVVEHNAMREWLLEKIPLIERVLGNGATKRNTYANSPSTAKS